MTEPNVMQRFQRFIDQAQRFAWEPEVHLDCSHDEQHEDLAEQAREHVEAMPPDEEGRKAHWGYDPSEPGMTYVPNDIFIDERDEVFIDGAPFPFATSFYNRAKVVHHGLEESGTVRYAEVTITLVARNGIVDLR